MLLLERMGGIASCAGGDSRWGTGMSHWVTTLRQYDSYSHSITVLIFHESSHVLFDTENSLLALGWKTLLLQIISRPLEHNNAVTTTL